MTLDGRITVSNDPTLASAVDMAPVGFDEEAGVYIDPVIHSPFTVRLNVRDAPRRDDGELLGVTSLEWLVNGEHYTTDTSPTVRDDPAVLAMLCTLPDAVADPGPLTVTARLTFADDTTVDVTGDCVIE